jgi:hypothetical protein
MNSFAVVGILAFLVAAVALPAVAQTSGGDPAANPAATMPPAPVEPSSPLTPLTPRTHTTIVRPVQSVQTTQRITTVPHVPRPSRPAVAHPAAAPAKR